MRLDSIQRTPAGAIRVNSSLTRAGVFRYTDSAGKTWLELRPEDEVSKADAIASMADLPVTIGHPRGGMNPDAYGSLNVGHIRGDSLRYAEPDVMGTLVISRRDAIDRVNSTGPDRLCETSMGYDCRIDNTAGVHPKFGRYDRIQRDMVYNHVATLRAHEGRLGTGLRADAADVFARLDAAGDEIAPDADQAENPGNTGGSGARATLDTSSDTAKPKGETMKLRIDGKEVEVDEAKAQAEIDRLAKAHADSVAEQARRDAADAQAARAALEGKARKMTGKADAKFDGQTNQDVMVAAVKHTDGVDLAGKDAVYIAGRFDAAFEAFTKGEEAKAKAKGKNGEEAPAPKADGVNPFAALINVAQAGSAARADGRDGAVTAAKETSTKVQDAWKR